MSRFSSTCTFIKSSPMSSELFVPRLNASNSYCCNICGVVLGSVEEADNHVKLNHFFPEL
ncbi:hypothetical protein DL89DRAFT_268123 [Linderina pennispora]|uniref:C2H2-type domain-containing protein n=1 Tax=Linderina pennispora TaxID=61395 RepID=A0A1Y1W773_9FUNG|nr:uncharacterized protein DL89DRAFT_268123 [Linderina pennispora]ORX69086.1 hypothetical protein DL89DRAFT_268123 [Linderina pennispora]